MDTIQSLLAGGSGLWLVFILLILAVGVVFLPLFVWGIYRQACKQTKLIQAAAKDSAPSLQLKLLTEIRDTLKAMQAVGVEVEQTSAPMSPPSIDPRRERLRR